MGKANNNWTEIQTATMTINRDTAYRLKVVTSGSSIKIYVDDVLKIDTADTTWTSGQIGLRCYKAAAEFDNIMVTE